MKIEKITADNLHLIPRNMNVNLIGNVEITYINNSFEYAIINNIIDKDFSFPTSKPCNISEFNKNRYGYIMTNNGQYVGHTVVEHRFNNTLYIEDFDISSKYRGKSYAEMLMYFLEDKAKECKLGGMSLEVQSNNVIAFLFYLKSGYTIEGFDLLTYEKTRQKGEAAIYLYKLF